MGPCTCFQWGGNRCRHPGSSICQKYPGDKGWFDIITSYPNMVLEMPNLEINQGDNEADTQENTKAPSSSG